MRRTFVLSTCLIFIMAFVASPVLADSMVPTLNLELEATNQIIDTITCYGTGYTTASDLITGTTKRYDSSDSEVTSTYGKGDVSSQADNFNFQSNNLTSMDSYLGVSYLYTIFDQPVSKVFVVADYDDSDTPPEDGSIWGITGLSGGTPSTFGSEVTFGDSNWDDTGYQGGWGGNRAVYLMAFELTDPVHGIKIVSDGLEVCSISGAPVPIPGAIWLLGSGVVGLLAFRRRARK